MSANRVPLRRLELTPEHRARGNVDHFIEGRPMERPKAIEIVRLREGDAHFILYLDQHHNQMTESWHPSLEAALLQAKWEWGIEPDEWVVIGPAGV